MSVISPVTLQCDTFVGALTGNAATATKLATARTIAATGDFTWNSGSFDGSANVTAAATLATVNSNVGTFGAAGTVPIITVNAKGLITAVTTATVAAAAGTLTGSTLAAGVTASSLTSVGTLTSLSVTGSVTTGASGDLNSSRDVLAGRVVTGSGANPGGFSGSRWVMDYSSPQTRIFSYGPDTSTNGTFLVKSTRSNETNQIELLNITTTTATVVAASWTYNSDERLKENISDLEGGLSTVLALRPRKFDYIVGAKNQLGFIAQESAPHIPEAIEVKEDGMLGLRTGFVIPHLVLAVKQLNARLEMLEAA